MVDGRVLRSRVAVAARDGSSAAPAGTPTLPVLLLPGLGLSGRYLVPVGAELADHRPVWIPDPPGFGRSDGPMPPLDIAGLADALAAWMAVVGIDRAVVAGNSMGCQVAVELAVRHPHLVTHLVLEAPTLDSGARSLSRQISRIARDALQEPPSLGPMQVRDWLTAGPRRLATTTRHMFAHHIEERARSVSCAALVVRGGRDPIVPAGWAAHLSSRVPGAHLVEVAGGVHAMPFSDPVALADVIETFIEVSGDPSTSPLAPGVVLDV